MGDVDKLGWLLARLRRVQVNATVPLRICDNGSGMAKEEFSTRWRTLDYDRTTHQGDIALPPENLKLLARRHD